MRRFFAKSVTILWALILAGLLLPGSSGSPTLHSFLKPGLWWLVATGALISALFFLVSFAGDRHTHSHVKSRMGALLKLVLLVVPVPFILAFGKAEYGSDALAGRLTMKRTQQAGYSKPIAASTGAEALETPSAQQPADKDSVYQADLMELLYAPESFFGRRVKTTGMMYQGDEIPEHYLYCFRYVMVCCAADAMPVGVFIDKPDSGTVEKNAWYEIEGTIHPDSLDGYSILKLDEAVMRPVQKPEVTWLYPR
ncbi:MAG: TIGR03943 family protein, partial [Chitinivibrionales bacterium]|nr:TIGR03943 family protein [Chitinivibrionales bacterium]